MKIQILYQDKNIIVCLKPVGVQSESPGMPELLSEQCGAPEIFCVHRLDKGVGGLMVYAKTKAAAAGLTRLIADGTMQKTYLAVLGAVPAEPSGVLRDLLYRDSVKNRSYVVKRMRRGVKNAELEYKTLEVCGGRALAEVILHTGRTHQIRVQFASRAMPLLGDVKYGSVYRDCAIALWSCRLSFAHPVSGKPLSFFAPPPCVVPWSDFDFIKGKENENV